MQIRNHIPNFITCLNLFAGCIAVVAVFDQKLTIASLFIGIAIIFDFLDGMAARILHAKSDIGKQLDSLADIVSFGVAPGMIIYKLLDTSITNAELIQFPIGIIPYFSILIPIFSALRLAKFNIDTRQSDIFYGLPTPANAVFLASLPLILAATNPEQWIHILICNTNFLLIVTFVFSGLLVANIRLFSLKFANFSWDLNRLRYVFLFLSLTLIILLKFIALPLIIIMYILISLIFFRR
ncbi:MAG: CDP-diacylglycerol--serine O-phosphatidyltransferase [Bacteroidetes bacterium]|nr:CDP-diacylglycerol--serine O-phosphatidyltransferase [Bacteroidota bacterium]